MSEHLTGTSQGTTNLLTYEAFVQHLSIIIQAPCGAGKTFAVAENITRYMKKNQSYRVVSLTTLQTLSAQHELNFKDCGMKRYLNCDKAFATYNAISICINSTWKLDIDNEEMGQLFIWMRLIASWSL